MGPRLFHATTSNVSAGRSVWHTSSTNTTAPITTYSNSSPDLVGRAGVIAQVYPAANVRRSPRNFNTNMTSYTSTTTLPSAPRPAGSHGKLHKRAGSASSLPAPPSPFTAGHSSFPTPYATYEEPFPDYSVTPPPASVSTPKIKPYLRKMSAAAKEEQGRLDLSRSTAENERLAGLGISSDAHDRTVSDVTFSSAGRRTPHMRSTSNASQMSTSSGPGAFRPTQPFVHPMRQTPRPFTPSTRSYASSLADLTAEDNEMQDGFDDDFRRGHGFRSRRSMSISSTPQIPPTPLSQNQSATAIGLRAVPRLTSTSPTNLSVKSARSGKSSDKSKHTRARRDTSRSADMAPSLSSRASFDKAFSFVSRRSEAEDTVTREGRIRDARRRFEQKEAGKDRKLAQARDAEDLRAAERQERKRSKSEASVSSKIRRPGTAGGKTKSVDNEKTPARVHEQSRATLNAGPPGPGRVALANEKLPRLSSTGNGSGSGAWPRFSTWLQTRLLSCGRSRT